MNAAVARSRHALFSILMSFPASCFIVALVTDLVYAKSYNIAWATFSIWLLAIGLVAAAVVVTVGLLQALVQGIWPTMAARIGYASVLVLSIFNAFVHSRDGYTSVVPLGLALSAIVTLILLATWIVGLVRAPSRQVSA